MKGIYQTTPVRERLFENQVLEFMDRQAAEASRGNEIARPRAIVALKAALARRPVVKELAIGFYVQLKDYDAASQSFQIRYPEYYGVNQLNLGSGVFRGASLRSAPYSGYTPWGTTCVWEPGNEFPRSDLGSGFFVALPLCTPHADPKAVPYQGNARENELPTFVFLRPPANALWSRLPMDQINAEAVIREIGPSRSVWAELVFDVEKVTPVFGGPFDPNNVYTTKQPALDILIQPRVMFLWTVANGQGSLKSIGFLGDGVNAGGALNERVSSSMVASHAVHLSPTPPNSSDAGVVKPGTGAIQWIDPPPAKLR